MLKFIMPQKKPSTKKLTFSRYIWFIDQAMKGKNPNARTLADEFEISQVQAQRDIEFMRDRLGAPLEYQYADKGYVLTDDSFCLPSVWIEEEELLLLAVAKELIHDGDARKVLATLFEKILPVNGRADIDAISDLISYKGTGCYRHPAGILSRLMSILLESREAGIQYRPPYSTSPDTILMSIIPRHLLYYKTNWYLLAHSQGELHTFALSRIEAVTPGTETADKVNGVVIRELINNAFGIFITDVNRPIETVQLRFPAYMAQYIESIVFHPRQTITTLEDGRVDLIFSSTINRELINEVMRFIDKVEIVEPEVLRIETVKILQKGLSRLTQPNL